MRQEGRADMSTGSLIAGVPLDDVYQIQAHTVSDTLTAAESGKLCTNRGAGAEVILTLPASPPTGTWFRFRRIATFSLKVTPPAGVPLRYSAGARPAGFFLQLATDEAGFRAVYDGTDWDVSDEQGTLTPEFTPTDAAGLQLWLDASDASTKTLTTGDVTQWDDKSTNAYAFTVPVGGNAPLDSTMNGIGAIYFDDANVESLSTATAVVSGAPVEVWVAGTSLAGSFSTYIAISQADYLDASHILQLNRGTGNIQWIDTAASVTGFAERYPAYGNLEQTFHGRSASTTSRYAAVDGVDSTESTTSIVTSGMTVTTIGFSPGLGRYLDGRIGEILVYNQAVSSGDRASIEAYLAAKWVP